MLHIKKKMLKGETFILAFFRRYRPLFILGMKIAMFLL